MGRNGFAVVDLETTGLSNQDRIVEIGVVLLCPDFSVERTWETLIQPERDIPNSYIHKITATDVVDAPLFCDVAPYLGSLLNGRTLVAHNASFEHRFLTNEFARAGAENGLCEWLDTMRLTKQYMGVGKLSEALVIAKIRNRFAHSALADAEATAELLRYLCVGNRVDVEKYPAATFTTAAAEAPCLPRGGAPSWAGQLSRTLPAATTKREADYRTELTCALVDRVISRTEMRRLESTAIAAGLSADDVDAINEEFTRQLAVEAWADGVITDEERATLLDIAEALNVDAQLVRSLLDEPTSGPTPATFSLRPGDRVAFTGALDIPRDVWTDRATAAGLDVGGVTRTCAVLVAANQDSMSGKAKRARENSVPIISETHFAQLLKAMEDSTEDAPVAAPDAAPSVSAPHAPEQFSWLTPGQSHAVGSSRSRIAAAWIDQHPDRPLHEIADNLEPHHIPEATGRGIDRYLAMWSLEHPEMLNASADDLLDLHGVGPKRRSQLVEMVVDLAVDGVEEPVEAEAVPEAEVVPAVAPEASDPTPDELLAAAYSSAYVPSVPPLSAPAQPSSPGPLPVLKEKTNVGATILKWSGIVGGSSFVLVVLLAVILGMAAEHPVADFLISISALSLIVAIFASPLALIRWLLNKRR
ncbi:exonuclease domain-containing protein [Corynebacterium sp. MC-17D]|uniref:3'-5' exoribonuclease n=1 Tax=Corynebacterium lipophilum TaxID=2804918 RepID=A0AAW5HR70_9CORY|nr:exonuclease domain-containing protein [Corynebacterium lipophilum]MCO6393978.1 3'-5' exoribonuclease [Corynebacterium lipophilum]MCZ2116128.1 exonuclease domain-containing protein [Corynebacterium lipophilum]